MEQLGLKTPGARSWLHGGDQGGHDKTNCKPVILSTLGPVSQKTALTFGSILKQTGFDQTQQRQVFWQEIESTSGFGCSHFSGRLPEGRSLRLEAVRWGVVYFRHSRGIFQCP